MIWSEEYDCRTCASFNLHLENDGESIGQFKSEQFAS